MKFIKIAAGVLIALFIIGRFGTSQDATSSATETMASVDTKPIKDSCARLTSILGYHSNRSSAQKDDLWGKTYKNRQFKWKLQLVSADKAFDDDYEVTFACLPPSEHQAMVKMTYPESMKSVVLKFKKGTPIEVTGTLKEYENPPDDLADKVSIRITAEPKN